MEDGLISVIVPVYNVEKYLNRCIDSIIGQTYKNLEIILVDDGSIDNSGKICDEYAAKDSRVKVIHKENGGVSSARNAGIFNSTGEYIGFVDSDDYIDKEFFSKLIFPLEKFDFSLCRFYREYGEEKIEVIEDGLLELVKSPKNIDLYFYESKYAKSENKLNVQSVFGSVCRCLFSSKIIKDFCLQFDESVKAAEDLIFCIQYIFHVKNINFVNEFLYFYVSDRVGSATNPKSKYEKNMPNRLIQYFNKVSPLIENSHLSNESINDLLIYLKNKFIFDIVINEIKLNENCVKNLRRIFKNKTLKTFIKRENILYLKKCGAPFRRIMLFRLIKIRAWWIIKKFI